MSAIRAFVAAILPEDRAEPQFVLPVLAPLKHAQSIRLQETMGSSPGALLYTAESGNVELITFAPREQEVWLFVNDQLVDRRPSFGVARFGDVKLRVGINSINVVTADRVAAVFPSGRQPDSLLFRRGEFAPAYQIGFPPFQFLWSPVSISDSVTIVHRRPVETSLLGIIPTDAGSVLAYGSGEPLTTIEPPLPGELSQRYASYQPSVSWNGWWFADLRPHRLEIGENGILA